MVDWLLPILGPVIALLNGLGVLPEAKKLAARYQEAANQLAKVLEELEKNYMAIRDEVDRFTSISFDPKKSIDDNLQQLKPFNPNLVTARMKQAKGHCAKISNIYSTYLKDKLFDVITDVSVRNQIESLFAQMSGVDGEMGVAIDKMSGLFGNQIEKLRDLLKKGKIDKANALIKQASREIEPTHEKITDAIANLQGLQTEYIQAAKTV